MQTEGQSFWYRKQQNLLGVSKKPSGILCFGESVTLESHCINREKWVYSAQKEKVTSNKAQHQDSYRTVLCPVVFSDREKA